MTKAGSASTRGCNKRSKIDEITVLDEHLVGQHTEIRLIHAQNLLHRSRRQTHLAADDPLPVGDPPVDVDGLDRVGVLDNQFGVSLGELRDRSYVAVRVPEFVGKLPA